MKFKKENNMNLLNENVPTGTVKQFGHFGNPYLVGEGVEKLPNGDTLVKITLLQSGETDFYNLSNLLRDPEAE